MRNATAFLILSMGFVSLFAGTCPMGEYNPDSKNWLVTGDGYRCTFFQGCMYPVWFTSAGKTEFPFFILVDQFRDGKRTYKIQEERWAEFEVEANTPDRFAIVCRGNFCDGLPPDNTPCKNVAAEYRYTFRRDRTAVGVEIRLAKKKPVKYDVELLRMRWRFRPFDVFRTAKGDVDLAKLCSRPGDWRRPGGVLVARPWNLRTSAKEVLLGWRPHENGFLYLCDAGAVLPWPAEEPELKYHATWTFESTGEARP